MRINFCEECAVVVDPGKYIVVSCQYGGKTVALVTHPVEGEGVFNIATRFLPTYLASPGEQ